MFLMRAFLVFIAFVFFVPNLALSIDDRSEDSFDQPFVQRSLRDVAHSYKVRGGDLAVAIGLPRTVDKGKTLWELGVDESTAKRALAQLKPQSFKDLKSLEETLPIFADQSMSIRELAHANDINGISLIHALELSLSVDKDVPVATFGISTVRLRERILHLKTGESRGYSFLKYWFWPPLLLLILWWLKKGGRYKRGEERPVAARYPRAFSLILLSIVVVVFGFLFGKSPNPMEGIVKVFKASVGIYPDPYEKLLFLLYFSVFVVFGNKLICGWGCPFGALQELLYEIPLLKKGKKIKLPFVLTQAIRNFLFLFFILVLFGWIGWPKGMVIYHYVNPFNLFSLEFGLWTVSVSLAFTLLLALLIYRPFCQLICPFGWYSWLLEKFSFAGIKVDAKRCVHCGACVDACPTEAAQGHLEGRNFPPDCFSCARCLRVCPEDAVEYGCRLTVCKDQ